MTIDNRVCIHRVSSCLDDFAFLGCVCLRGVGRVVHSLLNQRVFFLPFMPWSDVGRQFQLPPHYESLPTPPPSQTFRAFITTEFVPSVYSAANSAYLTTYAWCGGESLAVLRLWSWTLIETH